jgi:hypothetical protein
MEGEGIGWEAMETGCEEGIRDERKRERKTTYLQHII